MSFGRSSSAVRFCLISAASQAAWSASLSKTSNWIRSSALECFDRNSGLMEVLDVAPVHVLQRPRMERHRDSPVGMLGMQVGDLECEDDRLAGSGETPNALRTLHGLDHGSVLVSVQRRDRVLNGTQLGTSRARSRRPPTHLAAPNGRDILEDGEPMNRQPSSELSLPIADTSASLATGLSLDPRTTSMAMLTPLSLARLVYACTVLVGMAAVLQQRSTAPERDRTC